MRIASCWHCSAIAEAGVSKAGLPTSEQAAIESRFFSQSPSFDSQGLQESFDLRCVGNQRYQLSICLARLPSFVFFCHLSPTGASSESVWNPAHELMSCFRFLLSSGREQRTSHLDRFRPWLKPKPLTYLTWLYTRVMQDLLKRTARH